MKKIKIFPGFSGNGRARPGEIGDLFDSVKSLDSGMKSFSVRADSASKEGNP